MKYALRNRRVDLTSSPVVMGILNVTPDSFSDGGAYLDPRRAVEHAMRMIDEGADIIDVGPESTRPGADEVTAEEQIRRAIPVVQAIREVNSDITISIDTRSAAVARSAIESGADMVNDISALRDDPDMASVVAESGAGVVLMHRRGRPVDMQNGGGPAYDDVVGEICAFLQERIDFAVASGIHENRVIVDPGIGFGKRVEHNLEILRHIAKFVALGRPVLVGASRKSFVGSTLAKAVTAPPRPAHRREAASIACAVLAVREGASILRVHDVASTRDAVRIASAVQNA